MNPVFGDTVYFLALLNPTDQFHLNWDLFSADAGGGHTQQ
jgi:hypothetical protein